MHPHPSDSAALSAPLRTELDRIEKLARGLILEREGQHVQSLKLCRPERLAFTQAKERGYLVASSSYRKVRSIWFLWCRAMAHPYVVVSPRRRYAAVDLDLAAYQDWVELTTDGLMAAREILQRYTTPAVLRAGRRRDPYLHGSYYQRDLVAHMDVPIEDADALALELLQLARTHTITRFRRDVPAAARVAG